jgi:hypothetical protein
MEDSSFRLPTNTFCDERTNSLQTHPNIDKALYNESKVIALNGTKAYPVDTPSSVLKWRWSTKDEQHIPIRGEDDYFLS